MNAHVRDNLDFLFTSATKPNQNAQTGTGSSAYTFALADATGGKIVLANAASAATYTVPQDSSVAWPAGSVIRVVSIGAGVITFAAGSGATVNNTAATLNQYDAATLVKTAANTWSVIRTGTGGWTSYTPTLTDFTLGNGSVASYYMQAGKLVVWRGQITYGSSTAYAASTVKMTIPVTSSSNAPYSTQGNAVYYDTSASLFYPCTLLHNTTSNVAVRIARTGDNGAYLTNTAFTTEPRPTAAGDGDWIAWTLTYEAA